MADGSNVSGAELATALEGSGDRKDLLREQFDALEATQTSDAVPVADKTPAPLTPEAQAKADRARDESGKFISGDKTDKVAAAKAPVTAQAAPQTPGSPPDLVAQSAAAEPAWKRPPLSWKKDFHDFYARADPKLQEYVTQREEQMKAGVQQLLPKAAMADEVTKVSEPYMNTIRGLGMDVPRVLKGFLEADNILRTGSPDEKLAYLIQIGQNYGVNFDRFREGAAQTAPQAGNDPRLFALQNELAALKGEWLSTRESAKAEADQVLQTQIEEFARTHEHFDAVRPAMGALLQSGQAKDLDEAYRKAVRLDDSLYEAEIGARQTQTVQSKNDTAKAARAAAVSVRGSTPGSNTASNAKKSRREQIAELVGGLESRV